MADAALVAFSVPDLGEDAIEAVVDAIRSTWLTTGPRAEPFEREFQAYLGAAHALAVNSCTAAMHLALAALGVGPGDEVITTPLTFCATVNVILQVGATPVLADIGEELNLDPTRVEAMITPRTKAILPVHYGGLPCRMQEIWALAEKHGLKVIEDGAHAAGAEYRRRKIDTGPSDSVHFIPIPLHPYYRRTLELRDPCERALAEYPRLVSLPIYSKMTDAEVERVIEAVRGVVEAGRRKAVAAGL